eukprot:NODE_258_length_12622_cov_0.213767.p6 type:complete len:135 gc:universal NODE_258_length_12622_cov_0.213767:1625-1221(-)
MESYGLVLLRNLGIVTETSRGENQNKRTASVKQDSKAFDAIGDPTLRDLLEEQFGILNNRFDKVEDKMDKMEDKMDKMEDKMDKMEDKMDKMGDKMDKGFNGINSNLGYLTESLNRGAISRDYGITFSKSKVAW